MNPIKDAVKVETEDRMQYHLKVRPGDLAEIVLMPGDPKRVAKIIQNWDTNEKVADYRQFVSYRGKYKGNRT